MQGNEKNTNNQLRFTKLVRRFEFKDFENSWVKLNKAVCEKEVIFYSVIAQLSTLTVDVDGRPVILKIYRRFEATSPKAEYAATAFFEKVRVDPVGQIIPPERVLITKKAPWGRISLIERTAVGQASGQQQTTYVVKSIATKRTDRRRATSLFREKERAEEFFEAVTVDLLSAHL